MPPVLLALAAAAGFVAAARLISRVLTHAHAPPASGTGDTTAETGKGARNLGHLEWDESAGVYRPRTRQQP